VVKFAGIQNPYMVGDYGVEKNAKVLHRYRYIHEKLLFIQAAHLPAREDWDLKSALGKHLYEDAEAADQLRKRLAQLRTALPVINRDPDPSLTLLMDELIHANNDLELTIGIYDVIKPALIVTYKKHLTKTQQIVDQPTIRILKGILADLEDQVEWGREMIKEIQEAHIYPDTNGQFMEKLTSFLRAAGGIDGLEDKTTDLPRRFRSHQEFQLPLHSKRDPRKMGPCTLIRTGVPSPSEDPIEARLQDMMRIRQEEMTAAELLAGVIYIQKNMPWEFYFDLARHLWDEVRHSLFGQAALEAEGIDWMSQPQYTSDYDINAQKLPGAQYTWLSIGIEEGAMTKTGKRAEYEFCRDQAKHPLMAQFQDYDWADEIVHAGFGRKWTPDLIGEDIEFVREVAKKELDHFWEEIHIASAHKY